MTTLSATTATVDRTTDIARASNGRVVLWAGPFVIAAAFLVAGGSKFAGAPAMVALFNAIGIGQWFRYVTATKKVAKF